MALTGFLVEEVEIPASVSVPVAEHISVIPLATLQVAAVKNLRHLLTPCLQQALRSASITGYGKSAYGLLTSIKVSKYALVLGSCFRYGSTPTTRLNLKT